MLVLTVLTPSPQFDAFMRRIVRADVQRVKRSSRVGGMASPGPPTAEKARPSDSVLFPVDDFDRYLLDTLLPEASTPGRWSALNAVRHANRAWKIREIDPQMAMFRAITGEEESATAIFHSVKRLRYVDADQLSPRNHVQKNAVTPFIEAVHAGIGPALGAFFNKFSLSVDRSDEKPAIRLKLALRIDGEDFLVEPTPPLHLRINHGARGQPERVWDFGERLLEMAMRTGADDVLQALRTRANFRNRLLYAAPDGIPTVQPPVEPGLEQARRNTFRNLKIFLMIDGYPPGQLFVQQALSAFVKMLGRVPKGIDFEGPPDIAGRLMPSDLERDG